MNHWIPIPICREYAGILRPVKDIIIPVPLFVLIRIEFGSMLLLGVKFMQRWFVVETDLYLVYLKPLSKTWLQRSKLLNINSPNTSSQSTSSLCCNDVE